MGGELPEGWRARELPGGAWRVLPPDRDRRPSGWRLAAAGLLGCAAGGALMAGLAHGGGGWRGLRLTLLLPLGLFLIGWGLARALGREEWRVEPDRLEICSTLLGFRRARRFRGAALRLIAAANGSSSRRQRALLRVSHRGAGPTRAGSGWWGLYVVERGERCCLTSSARGGLRKEELQRLGEWLSEQTGWPLLVSSARRKR